MIAKCFGNQHLERAISFSWESCNHSSSVPPRSSLPTHTRTHTPHTHAPLELFCPPEPRGGEGKGGGGGTGERQENKEKKAEGRGVSLTPFSCGRRRVPNGSPTGSRCSPLALRGASPDTLANTHTFTPVPSHSFRHLRSGSLPPCIPQHLPSPSRASLGAARLCCPQPGHGGGW